MHCLITHSGCMSTSEADRLDLYTRLVEILGPRRADILMGSLPTVDLTDVATKADIALLRDDVKGLHERIDRLFITLVTGLFVIVAAMAGVFAATIA